MKRLANSKHCFVCGMENPHGLHLVLESDRAGHVTGRIVITEEFNGWPGIVHGGILASILDEAAGRTTDTEVYPKTIFVTGSMNIKYRRPAPVNQELLIEAELIVKNGRKAKAISKILNANREILAEADVVYFEVNSLEITNSLNNEDQWILVEPEEMKE